MKYLSYIYRAAANFAFLALVYFSLNFIGTYQQRAIIAALVLAYAGMRALSALRSFYFFKAIQKARHALPEWFPLVGLEVGWTNIVPVDWVAVRAHTSRPLNASERSRKSAPSAAATAARFSLICGTRRSRAQSESAFPMGQPPMPRRPPASSA